MIVSGFRREVLAEVHRRRHSGDISARDALRIRFGLVFYHRQLKEAVDAHLASEGIDAAGFWDDFDPEKFKEMMAVILEFILALVVAFA